MRHRTERVASQQSAGEVVDISAWELSEDFPIFPIGSKPKRMVICPNEVDHEFLIPGHAYLFKRALGWQAYQIWSEIIAYRIGALVGVEAPPSFVAVDENGEFGALVEFFYGYPGEDDNPRLVHAADLLPLKDRKRGHPHHLLHNLRISRVLTMSSVEHWWARTLAFDALIGNRDRHPENWGFLFRRRKRPLSPLRLALPWRRRLAPALARTEVSLAPAFDNATSLGYETPDQRIPSRLSPEWIDRYVRRGAHHCSWAPTAERLCGHFELVAQLVSVFPHVADPLRDMLEFDPEQIELILAECQQFQVGLPFTPARAEFVAKLTSARQKGLLSILEGD